MSYIKKRLLCESVKFIELCQKKVLSGEINISTYVLLSNVKIDFLKSFLNANYYDVYFGEEFSNRMKKLFAMDYIVKCGVFSDVKNEIQ